MAAEEVKAQSASRAGKSGRLDKVKLAVAALLVAAGVAGYYELDYVVSDVEPWQRWATVIGGLLAGGLMVAWTRYGRELWHFMRNARLELRKVVWPNRNETLMTTGVVLAFVVIAGVFFWGLDLVLAWATRFLTQGG
jgi:preprotein translocase subunit SecE